MLFWACVFFRTKVIINDYTSCGSQAWTGEANFEWCGHGPLQEQQNSLGDNRVNVINVTKRKILLFYLLN